MCLPTDPSKCDEALKSLKVPPERRRVIMTDSHKYRVAPWHYDPRHRRRSQFDNKWTFREFGTGHAYRDADGKNFSFPPPNYSPRKFIDNEIKGGFAVEVETLPAWVQTMAGFDEQIDEPQLATTPDPTVAPTPSPNKRRKAPASRKRESPEAVEIQELKEQLQIEKKKLESALSHIEGLKATVDVLENDKIRISLERDQLKEENAELRAKIHDLERQLKERKYVLSYDDLKPGGALCNHVSDFTFFPDFDCNENFLDVINYTEACEEGRGVCENLSRYSKINMDARKEYNEMLRSKKDGNSDDDNEENVEAEYEAAIR